MGPKMGDPLDYLPDSPEGEAGPQRTVFGGATPLTIQVKRVICTSVLVALGLSFETHVYESPSMSSPNLWAQRTNFGRDRSLPANSARPTGASVPRRAMFRQGKNYLEN